MTSSSALPPFLLPGDAIGLLAPSRWADEATVLRAEAVIGSHGFEPVRGNCLTTRHFQFSGTDEARAADFQQMLDNPRIKAIMALRGGYGLIRIIDRLDFSAFAHRPKWLCGFSDFTIAHARANTGLHTASLHCSMPGAFDTNAPVSISEIFEALSGKITTRTYSVSAVRPGRCEGLLLGGNLSILQSLLGSPDELPNGPFILFIEDVGEYLYHIERLLFSLRRAGKMHHIRGLIAGGFTDMRDNTMAFGQSTDNPFGKSPEQIITELTAGFDFPLCLDFPAGHTADNRPLFLGRKAVMDLTPGTLTLTYL